MAFFIILLVWFLKTNIVFPNNSFTAKVAKKFRKGRKDLALARLSTNFC